MHFAAVIERAEKQIILASHGRRVLQLLDDTPVVPGDTRPTTFEHAAQARQILNDAEEDLREWTSNIEAISYQSQGMGSNLMPSEAGSTTAAPATTISADAIEPEQTKDKTDTEGSHLAKAITAEEEPVAV